MKFVVGINNKERWRLEYVLSCAWRLSHQFQVLFRTTSSVLIIDKWPNSFCRSTSSLYISCVWSLMYPTRVLNSYLMCFSSLSSANLKFNSSIQVFPETLFLVTVVSFKNTCWFFASNSQWPFLLYSSPAPFKPAESFSLVFFVLHRPVHTRISSVLQVHLPQSALEVDLRHTWENSRSHSKKHISLCLFLTTKQSIIFPFCNDPYLPARLAVLVLHKNSKKLKHAISVGGLSEFFSIGFSCSSLSEAGLGEKWANWRSWNLHWREIWV